MKKGKLSGTLAALVLLALLLLTRILPGTGGKAQEQDGTTAAETTAARPGQWMEIPQTGSGDSRKLYTVNMTLDGIEQRNYSFLWNPEHLTADWVAYPLCRGNIGEGKRSNTFGLNPDFTEYEQPVLERAYSRGNSGWYSRGHQIPSGDRRSYSANVQTFYGTNMTPQDDSLNVGAWGTLENKVREWAKRCDTMYVVTGCTYDGYDGEYVYDNDRKKVAVPTGYYKALLRLSKGRYYGCAFAFENRPYHHNGYDPAWAMSLSELEGRTGLTFFPMLEQEVGAELYNKIKKEDPKTLNMWQR